MKQNDSKKRLREIEKADKGGHTACVMELAKRFVVDYPGKILGWYYLGRSLYGMARYKEALAALRRLGPLLPPKKQHPAYSEIGHLYGQKGELRRAEAWYRKAVASDPLQASYYIFLGGILAKTGRFSEAEATHRKATRCRKGCIDEAYHNLGLVLRAQGRYLEARTCFRKALKIDPKYKEAREALFDVKYVIELDRHAS
jgi:tetratricopeptide (TPR) repeat protein